MGPGETEGRTVRGNGGDPEACHGTCQGKKRPYKALLNLFNSKAEEDYGADHLLLASQALVLSAIDVSNPHPG